MGLQLHPIISIPFGVITTIVFLQVFGIPTLPLGGNAGILILIPVAIIFGGFTATYFTDTNDKKIIYSICVGIIISFITLILGLKEYIGYNDVVVMFISFCVMAGIGGFLGKIADEVNRKILEIKYKILSNISESKKNILKNVLISILFVGMMSFIFVGLIFMPFGNPDIIIIQSSGFSPNSTLISPSTVTWINNDTKIHRVVSDYGLFDSGNITPGQSYSHYFRDVKAYPYHDSIDPSMKGTVLLPMSPGE